MYIRRVVIRNYRNIAFADVTLHPNVNVLVGANGSGKSSFISALRIALADDVSSRARRLVEEDFYRACGPRGKTQVLVSAEFDGFGNTLADLAARVTLSGAQGVPRLTYRFRPGNEARTAMKDGKPPEHLTIDDYSVERTVGGTFDPATLDWEDDAGDAFSEQRFQRYTVVEVPALRDVVQDLRRQRTSPLARLLETVEVSPDARQELETAMTQLQTAVRGTQGLKDLGRELQLAYSALAGDPTNLTLALGLAEANLASILRELRIFLSDDQLTGYELERNGLGFNNLIYIAMLIEIFRRRSAKSAGSQLLLVEEPEAHLHPQAQEALLQTLSSNPFQTIVTTHSTHIVTAAGLDAVITMDRKAGAKAQRLVQAAGLTIHDVYDLDRYLDATRGALLFARGVILVEGSAEQIIVPLYAMNIGIDLHRDGIQIVAVNGIHFDAYTKLLGINGIGKPHVVLTDGDDFRKDGSLVANYDDGANHSSLEGIFKNRTTFEYAITQPESLDGLLETARAFGLRNLPKAIAGIKTAGIYSREEFATLQVTVLRAAQDVGKARFAQRFGEEVTRRQLPPPEYIELAIRSIHASVHPERAEEFPQP